MSLKAQQSAPFFTSQPTNLTVDAGQDAVFSASAEGNPAPKFQWRFNGTNLVSETNASLRLSRVGPSAAGNYSVRASNSVGSVVSTAATLVVRYAPIITSHPTSLVVNASQSALFSVTAQGVPSPAYQWQFKRTNLPNRISSSLFLANIAPEQAGAYRVVVSNELDVTVSTEAMLTVNTFPPSFVVQPMSQTSAVGRVVNFSVTVTAAPPANLQWKFNGADLMGATRSTLRLTNQFTNAGDYSVVASNSAGVVTSDAATLTILEALAIAGAVDLDFSPATGGAPIGLQSDGKIVVAGGRVRLNPDGSTDETFNAGTGPNGAVNALVLQPDGKVVIAGTFTSVNGVPRNRMARLNSAGQLDETFIFAYSNYTSVNALGLQLSGKILYGGHAAGGKLLLDRLDTDGSPDSHFLRFAIPYAGGTLPGENETYVLHVLNDEILVGGDYRITKFHSHGAADTGFTNLVLDGIQPRVRAIAKQLDGKILVGGSFTSYYGAVRTNIVRLNADGSMDFTFNPNAGVQGYSVDAIALQLDGKILIGGNFTSVNGMARSGIARLNADGTLDPTFDATLQDSGTVKTIAIQPDGEVLIAGYFENVNGVPRPGLARLHGDPRTPPMIVTHPASQSIRVGQSVSFYVQVTCVPGPTFQWRFNGNDIDGATNQVLMLQNALAASAGSYTVVVSNTLGIATSEAALTVTPERVEAGAFEAAFHPEIDGTVRCMVEQDDGKLVIGGSFTRVNGVQRIGVARLLGNGEVDPGFDLGTGIEASSPPTVQAIALANAGKIYISGNFTNVNGVARSRIARLHYDGTLDGSFNTPNLGGSSGNPSPTVHSLSVQSDGKLIAAGDFTSVGGSSSRFFLARFLSDGAIDTNFNWRIWVSSIAGIDSVVVQNDQKILIGGSFSFVNSQTRTVGRLNPDGSPDFSFNNASNNFTRVHTLAIERNGGIVVGGEYGPVIRLLPNGIRDTNFNLSSLFSLSRIYTLATHNCGSVLFAGSIYFTNASQRVRSMPRLTPMGDIDPTFGTGLTDGQIWSIAVRRDNSVLIGGDFVNVDGARRPGIASLHRDPPGPPAILRQPTSQTATGGYSAVLSVWVPDCPDHTFQWQLNGTNIDGATNATLSISNLHSANAGHYRVAIMNPFGTTLSEPALLTVNREPRQSGSADIDFYPPLPINGSVRALVLQPGGKLIAAGNFTNIAGRFAGRIARFNLDGSFASSFFAGSGFDGEVSSLATLSDGRLFVGGGFTQVDGRTRHRFAILEPLGSLGTNGWLGFPGANDYVSAVAVQQGKPIVGGSFTLVDNVARSGVARLNMDGTVDRNFSAGAVSSVMAVAVQSDGKVLIGGTFTSVGQTARARIARLHPDGALDMSFNPGAGADASVRALAVTHDGKVIIGGFFSSFNGVSRARVARLHPDGTLDMSFNSTRGPDAGIWTVAVQPDGKVIVGGLFTLVASTPRNRIARLNVDGSLDTSFDPGSGANNQVLALTLHPGGKIFIGGSFTEYAGYPRDRVARLHGEVRLFNQNWTGDVFSAELFTFDGNSYALEFQDAVQDTNWSALPPVIGDGSLQIISHSSPGPQQRFYRVRSD